MKAIVLLSGGVDSTVMLAMAIAQGKECHAISFDYSQRHIRELESAKAIAAHYNISHQIIAIDPKTFSKSALVTKENVPQDRTMEEIAKGGIPSTYVPARNTLFLAYAVVQAEIQEAQEIHYGPNAHDSKPYIDCRPEYVAAFQNLINLATKQAVEGHPPKLIAPLIQLSKTDIVRQGMALKAPLELTFSCYSPKEAQPCERCDACIIRQEAFKKV